MEVFVVYYLVFALSGALTSYLTIIVPVSKNHLPEEHMFNENPLLTFVIWIAIMTVLVNKNIALLLNTEDRHTFFEELADKFYND